VKRAPPAARAARRGQALDRRRGARQQPAQRIERAAHDARIGRCRDLSVDRAAGGDDARGGQCPSQRTGVRVRHAAGEIEHRARRRLEVREPLEQLTAGGIGDIGHVSPPPADP
jgi:hypothetical protein